MNAFTREEICIRALAKFGVNAQEKMVIGEFGELLTLFGRQEQGRATREDWLTEIADCTLMLKQLAIIHGITPHEIEQKIDAQCERLLRKLD